MPETATEPEVKVGPGKFNNSEAFCWIDYASGSLDKMKTVKVWNSRDGKVPPSFKHPRDGLTYSRVPRTEISAIDEMPGLGEFIVVDENSKGEPKITFVTEAWQTKHRRLYSNPQAVINRLEGVIAATKKQLDAANQTIREKEEEIKDHKDHIINLKSDIEVHRNSYAEKDKQLCDIEKENKRLRHYYEIAHEFAGRVVALTEKDFPTKPEERPADVACTASDPRLSS